MLLHLSCLRLMWPFAMARQSLVSAAEAAEMILRVDEVITCAPRQRNE